MSTKKTPDQLFLEVFTNLIEVQYPEAIVEKNLFTFPSKQFTITVFKNAFYFQLTPSFTRQVTQFYENTSWYVFFLKFDIKLTARTGKTYSYPKLRDYLGDMENDTIMSATYIFACVNYCINFFSIAVQDKQIKLLNKLATEAIVTETTVSLPIKK